MSYFIEQPSSFGEFGGYFVRGVSYVGFGAIIVALICLSNKKTEQVPNDNTLPKIESVKQDTNTISPETIVYNSTKNLCR